MKKTFIVVIVLLASFAITLNWMNDTPFGCYQKAFAVGSTVCHQIPSHSYQRGETQFPLCARCSGLYLGSFVGLIYFFSQGKKRGLPAKSYLILLALLFLIWAGDGLNSFISDFLNRPFLYETTNTTRLVTGFGMGLAMSTALVTLFNVTVWKEGINKPLLHSPWQILGYALLSSVSGLVFLSAGETIFTILAYIGIVTVVVIITMLYAVFWVIMTRKEGQFSKLSSLFLYMVAGFGTAMLQITLLTLLRRWVLG